MEQMQEIIRERAMQYAEEAFAEHEEEVSEAFHYIMTCRFVARQSGLLALDEIAEDWKEENEIPLKSLLIGMVQEIVDAPGVDVWEGKACRWILESGYSGYEWYIANLYVTGCKNLYMGNRHTQYYLSAGRWCLNAGWRTSMTTGKAGRKRIRKGIRPISKTG